MYTAVFILITILVTCGCTSVNTNTPSLPQKSTLLGAVTTLSMRQQIALEHFKRKLLDELGFSAPPKVEPMSPEDEEILIERTNYKTEDCPGTCVFLFPTPFSEESFLNNKATAFNFGSSKYTSYNNRPITEAAFVLDLILPSIIPSTQYPLNIIFTVYQGNETSGNVTKKLDLGKDRYFEADISELVIAWQRKQASDLVLVVMVEDEDSNVIEANDVSKAINQTKRNYRSHMLKYVLAPRI